MIGSSTKSKELSSPRDNFRVHAAVVGIRGQPNSFAHAVREADNKLIKLFAGWGGHWETPLDAMQML